MLMRHHPTQLAPRRGVAIVLILALTLFLSATAAWAQTSLTVALYPYVPRIEQFKAVLQQKWKQVEPNVTLNLIPRDDKDERWDGGYKKDPEPDWDVFVFDGMFFEYFRGKGFLATLVAGEISNIGDFVPYALDGVKVSGGGISNYAGIPLLGCGDILFYQKSDTALAQATTLTQVKTALSQCTYTSKIPPDRRGMMSDLVSGTTRATLYLEAVHALDGKYPPPLPPSQAQVNRQAVANVQSLMSMSSYLNATADTSTTDKDPYLRSAWLSDGYGRALVGFTETMSRMTDTMRANIAFKPMPLSDTKTQPLFYADVIGINASTVPRGKRAYALKLANILADADTVVAMFGPGAGSSVPQYLMSTRPSVFKRLGQSYPLYNDMYALVANSNPLMFKLNAQARDWLKGPMKQTISSDVVAGYPCGCDQDAVRPIADNAAAPPICNQTCGAPNDPKKFGGWNGQWSNQIPGKEGISVCGCNVCPIKAP